MRFLRQPFAVIDVSLNAVEIVAICLCAFNLIVVAVSERTASTDLFPGVNVHYNDSSRITSSSNAIIAKRNSRLADATTSEPLKRHAAADSRHLNSLLREKDNYLVPEPNDAQRRPRANVQITTSDGGSRSPSLHSDPERPSYEPLSTANGLSPVFFVCRSFLPGEPAALRWNGLVVSMLSGSPQSLAQYRFCRRHPDATAAGLEGLHAALVECQRAMAGHLWDCSFPGISTARTQLDPVERRIRTDKTNGIIDHVPIDSINETSAAGNARIISSFDNPIALRGYRESAFYNALLAAGIMTQISRACAQGNLRTCGCRPEVDWRDGKWAWPDDEKCKSNHVEYANTFTRRFVNKRFTVRAKDLPHMVYVHNSRVGRRVVKAKALLQCRCHGLSGSCQTRTCWKVAPSLRQISDELKEKYHGALMVNGINSAQVILKSTLSTSGVPPSTLVYIDNSPTFCDPLPALNWPGTSGRVCSRHYVKSVTAALPLASPISSDDGGSKTQTGSKSDGSGDRIGSCDLLCCGRGHVTERVTSYRQCFCQFQWCCTVTCKRCRVVETISSCN